MDLVLIAALMVGAVIMMGLLSTAAVRLVARGHR
jgi:hypothetical protein